MPQNTTNPNPGIEVGYQNPASVTLALDAEVSGTDPVTGTQLTREFVVPVESISGQSSLEVIVPILAKILTELRAVRLLMEAGAAPDIVDEVDDILTSDEFETETEES